MVLFGKDVSTKHIPLLILCSSLLLVLPALDFFWVFWDPNAVKALIAVVELAFIISAIILGKISTPAISKNLTPWLLIWFSWTLLSTLLSEHPYPGLARWNELLLHSVFAAYLITCLQTINCARSVLLYSFSGVLILIAITYMVAWALDPQRPNWVSLSPYVNNIRHMGHLAAILLPVFLLLPTNASGKLKGYSLLGITLAWYLIIWSGGRGAFLTGVAIIAIYYWQARQHALPLLLTFIAGSLIAQLFPTHEAALNFYRFLYPDIQTASTDISSGRFELYYHSARIWFQQYWLFGTGADGFQYLEPALLTDSIRHPHNLILQLLLSYGLPGLLIPLVLVSRFIWLEVCIKRNVFALPFLAALGHSMTSGVFYISISLWFSVLAFTLITPQKEATAQKKSGKTFCYILPLCLTLSLAHLAQVINSQRFSSSSWTELNARYPLYFNSQHWLNQDMSEQDRQKLIRQTLNLTSTPCFDFVQYQQRPPSWCSK